MRAKRLAMGVPLQRLPLHAQKDWFVELEALGYDDVWSNAAYGVDGSPPRARKLLGPRVFDSAAPFIPSKLAALRFSLKARPASRRPRPVDSFLASDPHRRPPTSVASGSSRADRSRSRWAHQCDRARDLKRAGPPFCSRGRGALMKTLNWVASRPSGE